MSNPPRTTRLKPTADTQQQTEAAPASPSKLSSMIANSRTPNRSQQIIPRRAPFMWGWHPNRYTVEGGKVVPSLIRYRLEAGKHGIEGLRSGKIDTVGLETNAAARGVTLIPFEACGSSYCVELAPDMWASRFERLLPSGQTVTDQTAYLGWLEELMSTGVVPRPAADVCDQLLGTKRAELQHLAGREGVEHMRDAIRADITALEAAMREAA